MAIVVVADLDRCLPVERVQRCWEEFVDARCLPRLQVRDDLTLYDARPSIDFAADECTAAGWDAAIGDAVREPFGLDRQMRCRYLPSPGEGRARLYLLVHHAVTDGRGAMAEMQALLRLLDGQPVAEQFELPQPGTLRTFPWQSDRQAFIRLLRELRMQNDEAGPPQPRDWKQPIEYDRVPRFQTLVIEPDVTRALLVRAKRERASVYAVTAAAWLCSLAETVVAEREPTLQLATSVDLATMPADPVAARSAVVGIIAKRYRVDPADPWALARRIRSAMNEAVEVGEGELFFELARVETYADIETGARMMARALASAPPALSVTNMGNVDAAEDPAWVRTLYANLPTAPNQLVSAPGLTYRGRLVQGVATADQQVAPDVAEALVSAYRARIHDLANV
ncbi:MAG TPA: hypothetical protein VFT67_05935 [Jatrophihabitantaceae bacterium]|nr:hypothetical protein [Jatrophihabitantaceae bacterium]